MNPDQAPIAAVLLTMIAMFPRRRRRHHMVAPGGFRCGACWRLGLPPELPVVAVRAPMPLWAWPL